VSLPTVEEGEVRRRRERGRVPLPDVEEGDVGHH